MQPDDLTKFDKLQKSLFEDGVRLTEKDAEIRRRYQTVFVVWLENPTWSDKDIVKFMRQNLGTGKSQSYEDLQKIKLMLGNVRNAAKEWQRYRVVEMCMESYKMAKHRGDIKAMVMAADKLGKYTKLDKDELEVPPWDKMIPPQFEPTSDVSVLGITRTPEFKKRVEKLKRKYMGENIEIEDADVIEEN